MEKKSWNLIFLLIVVLIIIIIIIKLSTYSKSNPDKIDNNALDILGQDFIRGGSMKNGTNGYIANDAIEILIINRGTKDYQIERIEIGGCGSENGQSPYNLLPNNNQTKKIFVICDKPLVEGPFNEKIKITYSILGEPSRGSSTFESAISGNVSIPNRVVF